MMQPRNSLVLVRLIEKPEQKVGKITVPNAEDCYCEAEVVAVGPGIYDHDRSNTYDLHVGQRVFVQYRRRRGPGVGEYTQEGVRHLDNGEILYLFDQTNIYGIIASAVDAGTVVQVDPNAVIV